MMSSAASRLHAVRNQLQPDLVTETVTSQRSNSPDDIVIISARRTPICKARRGGFKNTLACDLLSPVLDQVVKDAGIEKRLVNDICVGNVLQPSCGGIRARTAQFFAGFPETTCLSVCNRQCSSGLQAVMNVAAAITMGTYDIGIGAGFESMSLYQMGAEFDGGNINPKMSEYDLAMECTIPMGITSENVAERYGITREQQDHLAMLSHQKAAAASASGRFDNEIVPIRTQVEGEDGSIQTIVVSKDDGIRPKTTMETLAKLKPAFQSDGSTTAGNSSQISDGAAAALLMKRSTARRLNLPILGVIRAFKVAGVKPDEMGVGPAVAIPLALRQAGLQLSDIDVFEINEAFASQATYCINKLGIPLEKVNPNGGAIALGHPLACTGARQVATLLHELKQRGKRAYGVISMCIGSGMGAAAVLEYEGGR